MTWDDTPLSIREYACEKCCINKDVASWKWADMYPFLKCILRDWFEETNQGFMLRQV